MSSLMEQAVVDADKLRAAAMRNAENSILERYSSDIKGALKTILEQAPPGMMDPMAMMEPAAPPAIEDEIPLAATGGEKLCPCPDDEVTVPITINLDDLIDIADMIKDEDAGVTPQMLEEPPMDPMMMGQPPMDPMLMESELVDISDILREDNHTVERTDEVDFDKIPEPIDPSDYVNPEGSKGIFGYPQPFGRPAAEKASDVGEVDFFSMDTLDRAFKSCATGAAVALTPPTSALAGRAFAILVRHKITGRRYLL